MLLPILDRLRSRVMVTQFRNRRRTTIIAVLLVLLFLAVGSSRFYTDLLWFQEVGFESVLWTSIRAQFSLGLIAGAIVSVIVWVNLAIAGRVRPPQRVVTVVGAEGQRRADSLDRYRDQVAPYARLLRLLIAGGIGLVAGVNASAGWRTYLLWLNRVDFNGPPDPQFGRNVGFYVFELPFFDLVLSWLWFALFVGLLVTIAAYYFYGAVRPENGIAGVSPQALAHVSVLLGFLALVKAGQYWLGRYSLNFSARGVVHGASYTDVHAQLPALTLLAIISVISAGLFLVNIRFRRASLPLAAVGIWILTSVLAGGVWPFVVQRFSVEPQEFRREKDYIERNIDATRFGFGLSDVEAAEFPAEDSLNAEVAAQNQSLLSNVRLWDTGELQTAYGELQAIRTYYQFHDVDVDRYEIDGEMRQVLLSARELQVENLEDRRWSNEHLQFTHGFGIAASLANAATSSGQPSFLVRDVPGTVALGAESLDASEQPRLYYGETFGPGEYSIVHTKQREVDYETEEGVQRVQYDGAGGVPLGSFLSRLAFAVRERDPNLVLSGLISGESQMLIYRNVFDRVQRAAPFLSLDQDPYPAVVGERLVWILDAYTSTRFYPYSQRFDIPTIAGGQANYVRNSVKAVVDAYDGTVKLYVIDEEDPLVQAWRNAFPSLFTDDPPPELAAHFRFPEDLFNVQSSVFRTYHMTDAENFYSKVDAWDVPEIQPRQSGGIGTTFVGPVPPTYLLIQLPGEDEQEFVLTRPFTPRTKQNMIALMVARSDPGRYGDLLTLQFPRDRAVLGLVQVDNLINQDVEISRELTLLDQQGSTVTFGPLITLPIEESILYVRPLFIQADQGGIPQLKKVILVSGEDVVIEDSFEEALSSLLGLEPAPPPEEPPPPDGGQGGGQPGELAAIVTEAGRVYAEAQEALADGDFEGYGRLIERLGRLLEQAEQLSL